MKKIKKVSVLLLSISIVVGSVFVGNINSSYAATAYKKQLAIGKSYKYDLDGDGDKDSIKVYSSGHKLLLKVNSTTKTLDSNCYSDYGDYDVKIYDFNKKDKSSEIVFFWSGDSEWGTKILKFKNNKCMLNKHYKDAMLKSYDLSNGMVTFEEYDQGRYNSFTKAMGFFCIYDKVQIKGYNVYNQYSANTNSSTRKNKYVSAKKLTAYTSTSGKKKAFTINKGSKAYVYELYQKGSSKYIRVKNSSGSYGYVKVGSSMLFTENSCLWWR
ncbi:hypothetical protein [Terrisporobacter mayombei]|uniref:SH3b domain-containing protein n=1 Tax=Terrisporobacter mayombei TaxID=1541 RepID=A0ABY9PXC8_9FIRM|nr:hypothetical protein [Terrisporobacter mayombei]MCC3868208.1 hypothetical protein [Terrisporobacter mayombei]WMT80348.1 hypothetical protein TEMA_06630 [Terrisporobacter mayombei]